MYNFDENNIENSTDTAAINIQNLLDTIKYYKKSIFLIAFTSTIFAFFYAFTSPNIYQVTSMIKIIPNDPYGTIDDFMNATMGRETHDIHDELVIFKTKHLAQKVLDDLEIGTRYFVTNNFKRKELYKASPFVLKSVSIDEKLEGRLFNLTPINKEKFKLTIVPSFKTKLFYLLNPFSTKESKPISYSKIHYYNRLIATPLFTFTVEKKSSLKNLNYEFSITKNNRMAGLIQGGVSTSFNSKGFGNIIQLTFTDTVPLRAKEILDTISKKYVEENLKYKDEGASKRLEFIDMQIKSINKELIASSKKIQLYKASNTFLNLNNKAAKTSTELSTRKNKLYDIKSEIDVMENILENLNKHKDLQTINIDSVRHSYNSSIYNIINQIQNILKERAGMGVEFTKIHPKFIKTTKQLNLLKKSLKRSIVGNLRTLKKQKTIIEDFIKKQTSKMKELPIQEQNLDQLKRKFLFNEKIYSFLLNKRAETSIIEASKVSNIRIIEEGSIPSSPIKPKRFFIILVGFLLGLGLGLGLAFLREFLDNTIKRIEDIEKLTDIPIYAVLPQFNKEKNNQHYFESVNTLWNNLEFSSSFKHSKLVTITSAVSKEGKSLTIASLAKSIAKNGQSVIVLDLDMRKPTLHEYYKLYNLKGISSLLTYKATLKEVIQNTDIKNLQVITSGPIPPNPAGLIMSKLFEKLIQKLKEHYDYVLIDSPPIGLVSDVMKIMHLSDITLIVVKSYYSKKIFIKNINRLTKDKNINPGIVLNGLKENLSYGYGYGYGYNYGHETDQE